MQLMSLRAAAKDEATPVEPGTNIAFANGMMHIFIEEDLIDHEFIEKRTEHFDEIKKVEIIDRININPINI